MRVIIKKTIIYRCKRRGCQKISSFFNTKLPITNLFYVIYLLLSGVTYKQLFWYYSISDATTSSIKKSMVKCNEKYCSIRPVFLGGIDEIVEADETVLCRRGIIRYPTSTDDEKKDTVWILGAGEKFNKKNLIRKI
ncbi:hypothetical protein DMUE_5011 [Dictyocoela muelleri]|nr:hypothetical protein DMUE_5011 [Dictyocoela muelleri]